jgi:hypothetical protein
MRDLLSTKSFRSAVAVQAGLDARDTDVIASSAYVVSSGTNLISIVARRPDAASAQAIVAAIVSQYQARTTTESQRETSIAVDYYNTQIGIAQTELDTRKAAATAYANANPRAVAAPASDATYARLLDAVSSQTKIVDGLVASLQDAQRKAATAPQSLAATFNVQDPPSLPSAPLPVGLTKRVGYPFAALVFGMLISATYLYVRFRTDHAIRSTEDLVDLPVPVLGAIPVLPSPRREAMRPATWLMRARRDYARSVAASISVVPARGELS